MEKNELVCDNTLLDKTQCSHVVCEDCFDYSDKYTALLPKSIDVYCVYCVDVLRGIDHSKSESSVPTEINDQWLNHKSQYSNVDHFPLSNLNKNNHALLSLKKIKIV